MLESILDRLDQAEYLIVDTEFIEKDGEPPVPICIVAKELHSQEVMKVWLEGGKISSPFIFTDNHIFVAFAADAELRVFNAMDWKLPHTILDLLAEFRRQFNGVETLSNGMPLGKGRGLLDACAIYGVPSISIVIKDSMRKRIIAGPPFTEEEKEDILNYCLSDVLETEDLLKKMLPGIDMPRALLRGEYMKVVTAMEDNGIPIDTALLNRFQIHWDELKIRLIDVLDKDTHFYEGTHFKMNRFIEYLIKNNMAWPLTEKGQPILDSNTLRDMVVVYPQLESFQVLRSMLSANRKISLKVGTDGRNRVALMPFASKTSRNQPSSTAFIFGITSAFRHLIKPQEGKGIAYIDYEQQEFMIAAALSGDQNMIDAYKSGDPYMKFAILAGAAPEGATKATHRAVRDLYKQCILAIQYGMMEDSLGIRIGKPAIFAKELIQQHKRVFWKYHEWQQHKVKERTFANPKGTISTSLGWTYRPEHRNKKAVRSVCNFPMQATGAEMIRLACICLDEAGIKLLAPVHDAIMIEFDLDKEEEMIKKAQEIMEKVSEVLLGEGNRVRTEAYIVRYPGSFVGDKGLEVREQIMKTLEEIESNFKETHESQE